MRRKDISWKCNVPAERCKTSEWQTRNTQVRWFWNKKNSPGKSGSRWMLFRLSPDRTCRLLKAGRGNARWGVRKVIPSGEDFQPRDAREDVVIVAFTEKGTSKVLGSESPEARRPRGFYSEMFIHLQFNREHGKSHSLLPFNSSTKPPHLPRPVTSVKWGRWAEMSSEFLPSYYREIMSVKRTCTLTCSVIHSFLIRLSTFTYSEMTVVAKLTLLAWSRKSSQYFLCLW